MTFELTVKKRDAGHAEDVRDAGRIPAIVYGAGIVPVPVSIEAHAFDKLYEEAGESSLIDFTIEGSAPTKVLVQDVQYDSIKARFIHVDFRQININIQIHPNI